ncbi:hypothetical protein WICPIJ_007792 [Wickerhamomyces pijperi]|uniref:Uncharacterized protein n=1 Tax=Wickerhamomyces pijperi TaxID=599730 RepID=A0A9P8TK36_WICPI|nr:hypothetical protein WICPIJ_007792 [Wickerhamomyces pijperi]
MFLPQRANTSDFFYLLNCSTPSNGDATPTPSNGSSNHNNKKKKQSLKDFLSDESYGHMNWADDDDYDPSTIALPTFNNGGHYHDNLTYQSNSYSEFGSSRFNHNQPYHLNSMTGPNSPPYIAKLTNIPSYFGIADIEDLFSSRFMKYQKLKVFWEINFEVLQISPDPLEALNHHKKAAFVELGTHQDLNKVLNWRDLYLDNGMGKVMTMLGNFQDFKTYNDLHQRVSEEDDPSLPFNRRRVNMRKPINPPQHNIDHQFQRPFQPIRQPNIQHQPKREDFPVFEQPLQHQQAPTQRRKSNPFGNAKPVDTLSRQLELESKLKDLEINKTTFRTLGHDSKFFPVPKHHQELFQDEKQQQQQRQQIQASAATSEKQKPSVVPTPAPKESTTLPKKPVPAQELKPAPQPQTSAWGLANTTANIINPSFENNQSFSKVSSPKSGTLDINRPSSGAGYNGNDIKSKKGEKKVEPNGKTKILLKRKIVNEKRKTFGGIEKSPDVEPESKPVGDVASKQEQQKPFDIPATTTHLPEVIKPVEEATTPQQQQQQNVIPPFKVQPQHMVPSPKKPQSPAPIFQAPQTSASDSKLPPPQQSPSCNRQGRSSRPESPTKYRSSSPVKLQRPASTPNSTENASDTIMSPRKPAFEVREHLKFAGQPEKTLERPNIKSKQGNNLTSLESGTSNVDAAPAEASGLTNGSKFEKKSKKLKSRNGGVKADSTVSSDSSSVIDSKDTVSGKDADVGGTEERESKDKRQREKKFKFKKEKPARETFESTSLKEKNNTNYSKDVLPTERVKSDEKPSKSLKPKPTKSKFKKGTKSEPSSNDLQAKPDLHPEPTTSSEASTLASNESTQSSLSNETEAPLPPSSPSKRNRKKRSTPPTDQSSASTPDSKSETPTQSTSQTPSSVPAENEPQSGSGSESAEYHKKIPTSSGHRRGGGFRGRGRGRGRGGSRGGSRGGFANVSKFLLGLSLTPSTSSILLLEGVKSSVMSTIGSVVEPSVAPIPVSNNPLPNPEKSDSSNLLNSSSSIPFPSVASFESLVAFSTGLWLKPSPRKSPWFKFNSSSKSVVVFAGKSAVPSVIGSSGFDSSNLSLVSSVGSLFEGSARDLVSSFNGSDSVTGI